MTDAERQALFVVIRRSWSADTSAYPAWTSGNPASGQCAVTALVVQDHLGGLLLRAEVGSVSHYWNLVGAEEVDLTREQFPEFKPTGTMARSRHYVLSFTGTAHRYEKLKMRVEAAITGFEPVAP